MSTDLSEQQRKLTTPLLLILCIWIFWSVCTSCHKTLATGDKKDRESNQYNSNSKRKRSHPTDEEAAAIAVTVMNMQLDIRLMIHSLAVQKTLDGYPKSIPDFSPIQNVSWFEEVFRPLQTDSKDLHAILAGLIFVHLFGSIFGVTTASTMLQTMTDIHRFSEFQSLCHLNGSFSQK